MKILTNLTPSMSLVVGFAAIVALGVILKFNLIDSQMADRALTFLLGGGAGAALVGGQVKGGSA